MAYRTFYVIFYAATSCMAVLVRMFLVVVNLRPRLIDVKTGIVLTKNTSAESATSGLASSICFGTSIKSSPMTFSSELLTVVPFNVAIPGP